MTKRQTELAPNPDHDRLRDKKGPVTSNRYLAANLRHMERLSQKGSKASRRYWQRGAKKLQEQLNAQESELARAFAAGARWWCKSCAGMHLHSRRRTSIRWEAHRRYAKGKAKP